MFTLWNDIKYAFRQLRKSPGFTTAVVLTLIIGIGANITIFNFVNTYLLRPLPFNDAERLVEIKPYHETFGTTSIAYSNYRDWLTSNQTFEDIACYRYRDLNLTGGDMPERVHTIQASCNLLSLLGTQPLLGRLFTAEDDQAQSEPTMIISYRLWKRRYGGDPNVVGQSVAFDGEHFTIIGVLPQGFSFPPFLGRRADIWYPIGLLQKYEIFLNRGRRTGMESVGKLKAGVTLSQAQADMQRVAAQLEADHPQTNANHTLLVNGYHDQLVGRVRPAILVLMGATSFILLIVCMNIASLLVVRATGRSQEFTIRAALGAGRLRITRQLICENTLLAAIGGIGALFLASSCHVLLQGVSVQVLHHEQGHSFRLDATMIVFITGLIVIIGFIFGLIPALQISCIRICNMLHIGARSATAGRYSYRLRHTFVIAQIAFALSLLVGAGLMLRSYQYYRKADPGYNTHNVLTMGFSLFDRNANQRRQFYLELLRRVKSLPGVQHVGLASGLLGHSQGSYYAEGTPVPESGQENYAEFYYASPGYFESMGIRLLEGRFFAFTEEDARGAPVTVVDEKLAQRWWPHESALGKRIQYSAQPDPNATWYEIVGVVSHVKHWGVDKESRETIYASAFRFGFGGGPTLIVRTKGDPMSLANPIRQQAAQINPDLPASNIRTLQSVTDRHGFVRRLTTALLGLFAGTALFLSALGIYSVTAYVVSQRTQEFGIRIALGAQTKNILGLVLGRGLRLAVTAVGLGLIASLGFSRLIKGLLFGVTAWDPVTFIIVTPIMVLAILLACYIPARRAAKIDPMEALRYE